ncbi:MAG TPA: diaminopimelate epimerase [bacterium]|nr:diaminopimelate epimerase [bacterium]
MRFHKYHAAGNDFIITDDPILTPAQAPRLCDRRTGIGADGILWHRTAPDADAQMTIINADGTIAEMCGNGIRCFCRYLIEQYGLRKERLLIQTGNGPIECLIDRTGGEWHITVDIGQSTLTANRGPNAWRVDIGNPHLVVRGPADHEKACAEAIRLQGEHHGDINVEMMLSVDSTARTVDLIVNERGAGFTQACGTGGGAVIETLHHTGILKEGEEWTLRFPGGPIHYRRDTKGHIIMRGDAQFVYSGSTDAPAR